jgi:hypothetical protein
MSSPSGSQEKAAGLITGYQIFLNQTSSNPDWDFGFAITYKDMAALDGLPDKIYDLRMKHFGDKTAEQKVIDKRVENYKFVSSHAASRHHRALTKPGCPVPGARCPIQAFLWLEWDGRASHSSLAVRLNGKPCRRNPRFSRNLPSK